MQSLPLPPHWWSSLWCCRSKRSSSCCCNCRRYIPTRRLDRSARLRRCPGRRTRLVDWARIAGRRWWRSSRPRGRLGQREGKTAASRASAPSVEASDEFSSHCGALQGAAEVRCVCPRVGSRAARRVAHRLGGVVLGATAQLAREVPNVNAECRDGSVEYRPRRPAARVSRHFVWPTYQR